MAVLIVPSLPFIKGRYPQAGSNAPRPSSLGNLTALKQIRFWIYIIGNTLQGLSFFLPGLFLPSKFTVKILDLAHILRLRQVIVLE